MLHVAWQLYLLISALFVFITVDVDKLSNHKPEITQTIIRKNINTNILSIKNYVKITPKPTITKSNSSKAPKQNTNPPKNIKVQTFQQNESYKAVLDSILLQKEKLKLFYQNTENKDLAIDSVSKYFLETFVEKLIPFWYGTSWSMSGTTQIPKQGYISCGYFVSNTLFDMGLNFNRIKIAQMASRNIARTFQMKENIIMLKDITNQEVVSYLKQNYNEGLFIVGLDSHSAFLVYFENEVYLLHSGRSTSGVVIEYAEYSNSFISNRYYIGEVTTNKELMLKWLFDENIPKIEIFEFGKK